MASVVLALALLGACTGGRHGPERASPSRTDATRQGDPALEPCTVRGDLLCGTVEVPLDRADPGGARIPITFYVHRHTDTSAPAGEPIFTTPGGPGSGGVAAMEFVLAIDTILAHHDIVAIDPRGTGRSGPIDCPDLQNGWRNDRELDAAVAACGDQLGPAADRYGSGDVALDVEAVRRAMGYDRIDFYAFSYGSVPEQAYAARFPEHLHALVFDAGLTVTDPGHVWAWRIGVPAALVREVALMCARDPACEVPNPARTVRWLVHHVAADPVRGTFDLPGGPPTAGVVDEAEVANLLQSTGTCPLCGQIAPATMMTAAASLRAGDAAPLLRLAGVHSRGPLSRPPPVTDFSVGDNIAALCNDQDFVWDRSDPIGVRAGKFHTAVAALPVDAFAPFSIRGWNAFAHPAGCLRWPAPDRFEPAVPAGAVFPDIPTLILAGDSDTIVPPGIVAHLRTEFPGASFVTVAGAGHPVTGSAWGHCAAELVAQLFDDLAITESCATAR